MLHFGGKEKKNHITENTKKEGKAIRVAGKGRFMQTLDGRKGGEGKRFHPRKVQRRRKVGQERLPSQKREKRHTDVVLFRRREGR